MELAVVCGLPSCRIGRLGVDVSTGNMTERLLDASDGSQASTYPPQRARQQSCRVSGTGLAPAVQSTFPTGQGSGADTALGRIHAGNPPSQCTAGSWGQLPLRKECPMSGPGSTLKLSNIYSNKGVLWA